MLLLKSFQAQFSIVDVRFGDFLLKIKLLVFHTAEDLIKSEESGIEHRIAVRNTFHLSFYKIILTSIRAKPYLGVLSANVDRKREYIPRQSCNSSSFSYSRLKAKTVALTRCN